MPPEPGRLATRWKTTKPDWSITTYFDVFDLFVAAVGHENAGVTAEAVAAAGAASASSCGGAFGGFFGAVGDHAAGEAGATRPNRLPGERLPINGAQDARHNFQLIVITARQR